MALADITLADGKATPVNHVFTYVATTNGRVIRSDFSAPSEEPLQMTLAHNESKRGGVLVKSHLLKFDRSVLDSDGTTSHAVNIRMMADIPAPVLSDALAADLAAYVRNWATADNVKAWLKGSVG